MIYFINYFAAGVLFSTMLWGETIKVLNEDEMRDKIFKDPFLMSKYDHIYRACQIFCVNNNLS
jgi:hypothetical protein